MKEIKLSNFQTLQKECYDVTVSKGFNPNKTVLQIFQIASELNEMLDNIEIDVSHRFNPIIRRFKDVINEFDNVVKKVHLCDDSTIKGNNNLEEETDDAMIAIMNFAEGQGYDLIRGVKVKKEINKGRPHLHNKSF